MIDDYKDYISNDLGDISLYSAMSTLLDQMHMMIPDFLGNDIISEEPSINDNYDCTILNDLQKYAVKKIYEKICFNESIKSNLLFIQGRAGTGNAYTTNALINILRKKGCKVLVTGKTGIAATQYENGTTCHSLFKLTIDHNNKGNEFKCNIGYGTHRAKELLESNLIIIDEISMLTIETAQNIDYTLRSLVAHYSNQNNSNKGDFNLEEIQPFGGKLILFVGDLLQLPPVVQGSNTSVANKLIVKYSFRSSVELFGLKEAVLFPYEELNNFLVDIGNGKSTQYNSWYDLKNDFNVTITRDFKEAV